MRATESYSDEYYDRTHRNWFENPHIWLFESIRKRIAALGGKPRVLDIGCGRGDFLRWLRSREPGWQLTGIDLAPNAPADGIDFIQGDILECGLGAFDAVVNLAVIEHVVDIHRFVSILRAHCAPGGMVLIMTINDRSALYSAGRILARAGMPSAFNRLYDRHHLNHFNVSSLRRLVELEGLSVQETILHNTPMNAVDMPDASEMTRSVWRAGVALLFWAGRVTQRTFLQTLVCLPAHESASQGPLKEPKMLRPPGAETAS
jgi:cyclopropane fatty-acyl-phospholipid synthase-like methyltransferase